MPTMLERLDLKPYEVREAGLVAAGVALGAAACLAVQGLLKMAKKPRSVKVTYFKMAGRAGPVRAALKLANIEYTNEFVDRESMKALKPKLPFGQVPVFEVNDEMVSQSNAFLRYVGKFSSLYPSDPFKALKVDEILDGVSDSMLLLRPSLIESDPAKKLRLRKELVAKPDGPLFKFLQNMEGLVHSNQVKTGQGKFAAGAQLSIADITLFTLLKMIHDSFFDGIPPTLLDDFPLLTSIYNILSELDCWGL